MTATAIRPAEAPARARPRRGRRYRSPLTVRYLTLRLLYSVIAVLGAVSVVFVMVSVSGNPAILLLPQNATSDQIALVTHAYGLDRPLWIRYVDFLGQVLRGNFPDSLRYNVPAMDLVLSRVPATLQLSGGSLLIAIVGGIALGYWLATTRHIRASNLVLRVFVALQAIPSFLLALLLVLVFSLTLRWLPTSGYTSYLSLVLPVATLVLFILPSIARIFRSSLVETFRRDHVSTAVAKGISARQARTRHVAINALGPTVSYIGLHLGGILGGAVVVESVFAYPGVGQLLSNAVSSQDFPVTLAAVYLIAIGYVVTSFVIDILLHLLDPQVEMG